MSKATTTKQGKKSKKRISPLWFVIGGIVLVAAGMFAYWLSHKPDEVAVPVEVSGSPSLKVDKESINFGDVKFNEMVTATFIVSNVGDQTLTIDEKPYIEVVEGC